MLISTMSETAKAKRALCFSKAVSSWKQQNTASLNIISKEKKHTISQVLSENDKEDIRKNGLPPPAPFHHYPLNPLQWSKVQYLLL